MTASPHLGADLAAYLALQQAQAFCWQRNNCCHFTARWVAQVTGRDPMQGLADTPDARAALRLVQQLGGDLRAAWSRQLAQEPISALLAQVGDVVLFEAFAADVAGVGALVGICAGRTAVVLDVVGNVLHLPLTEADCAWRITRGDLA
jgi:hypothetical protein